MQNDSLIIKRKLRCGMNILVSNGIEVIGESKIEELIQKLELI